jgi:hypothetical protein
MKQFEFELLEHKFWKLDSKLDEIIEKEKKIMAQIDDLNAEIAAEEVEIGTLGTVAQTINADVLKLLAMIQAGAKPTDLTGPLAKIKADSATLATAIGILQTADANANAPLPVISSALTVAAVLSAAFTYQITASGNPTIFGATGLPAGLTVDTAKGVISGIPTVAGVSNVTITATNVAGTGTATLILTVA